MPHDREDTMTVQRLLNTFGWGVFCSASWTWCIGMFLPFLLLARYGWGGFLAFFIPNVLGCALFGYVLTPKSAHAVRTRCASLCVWFSLATLLYQAFFAGWMLPPLLAVAITVAALVVARGVSDARWLLLAVGVTAVSAFTVDWSRVGQLTELSSTGSSPAAGLWALAPTIALGFVACPYLDLTFHRALERSPSKHAFLVFGVAFALTLLGVATFFDSVTSAPRTGEALTLLFAVQLLFTVAAHAREGWSPDRAHGPRRGLWVVGALSVGLALGWVTRLNPGAPWGTGDELYLRLLVLYGLVFPYFLLLRLRRVPAWLTVVAICTSLPFFELGFMRQQTHALFVPLGLLLVLLTASLGKWCSKEPLAT